MKRVWKLSAALLMVGAAATARAEGAGGALVVTSTNSPTNHLLVYDAAGALVQEVPTQGQGGAAGNAGGIAVRDRLVAVVNFGSSSVSVFERGDSGFALAGVIPAASAPLSVAFGKDHLYVLGTSTVESHGIDAQGVEASADGVAALVLADGSAAQVGVAGNSLVISEKTGTIETAALRNGAVTGAIAPVALPPGSDTPFGLVTRGTDAFVTLAGADEVALIGRGTFAGAAAIGTPGGGGQQAPCWIAIAGPYLFTANTPSRSITRLVASGKAVVLDEEVAAQTAGSPTDIAAAETLVAVIDSASNVTRLTQFAVGDDGALTQTAVSTIAGRANGVAIVKN